MMANHRCTSILFDISTKSLNINLCDLYFDRYKLSFFFSNSWITN